jgi:toxin ParE1/3/4
MKIRLSDEALLDLQEISNYTWAEWGEVQEKKYLALLYVTMGRIGADSARIRQRDDLYLGCRVVFCGKHSIFFTVEAETVCVARILHQAMDPFRHLT